MALLERLQILIDADAGGAVREFKKIGNTADRELGKATKSIDRMGAKLTSFGAGAVVGAAALGAGLAMFAKEAGEAETQQLKLTNSIKNSENAFAGNGKALRDQASALMKVTVADDDAIVSAQSLLVQFGRTSDEVMQLSPLVVDLSRKMGIDLDSAAKAVGKSSEGSSGALKKMGIEVVDLGGGATATQNTSAALASTVGGFAESEGQTFAGQMQIMSNSFSELKENVGKGVLEVVNPILGIGAAAGEVNPKIAETTGKLATIGAGAAGLVGALSVGTGAVMKMSANFTTMSGTGAGATKSLTGVGKAAGVIAGVGAAIVIYQIAMALDDVKVNGVAAETTLLDLQTEVEKTGKVSVKSFADAANATKSFLDVVGLAFGAGQVGGTPSIDLGGEIIQIQRATDLLKQYKKEGDTKALEATLKLLKDAKIVNGALTNQDEVFLQLQKDLALYLASRNKNQQSVEETTKKQAATTEELAAAEKLAETATKSFDASLKLIDDTFRASEAGAAAFKKSIEDSSTLDDQATAAFGMNEAYIGLFNTLNDLPKEFDVVKAALGDYTNEQNKAVEAVIKFGETAGGVLEQAIASGQDPTFLGGIFRSRLEETLKNANIPPEQVAAYIGLAGLSEQQIKVAITLSNEAEVRARFDALVAYMGATKDPTAILTETGKAVNEAVAQAVSGGNFGLAKNILDAQRQVLAGEPPLALTAGLSPEAYGILQPLISTLQAEADSNAVKVPAVLPDGKPMMDLLLFSAQVAANANPITVPVVASVFDPGGLFAPGGLLNPGKKPAPAGGLKPFAPSGPPTTTGGFFGSGQYSGGPVSKGGRYEVNEGGREFFTPSSDGFIMNASDAKTLVQGVSQIVSGGGGRGMTNNITINETSSPRQTALEVIRANKASLFLAGAL